MTDITVRDATVEDVPAMNAIYNEYIVDSHVSFDTEAWSDDKRLAWYEARVAAAYPVLVAEREGEVVGVSWSGPWRDKAAYRSSAETTIVLAPNESGRGIGSTLYTALLDRLVEGGFHRAYGIVALPNDDSVRLHLKLGYVEIGVLDEVGHKDGRYHSTMILEKKL